MNLAFFEPNATTLATALTLLKLTLVLVAALAVTLAMRRAPAGARHLVWLVSLAAVLVIPAVAIWAPVPIRVLPSVEATPSPASLAATLTPLSSTPTPAPASDSSCEESKATAVMAESPPAPPAAISTSSGTPVTLSMPNVATVLIGLWLVGVLVLLGKLAIGAWSVRRIEKQARVLTSADWQNPLYEIADRLGLPDAPVLLQSDRISIPFASGLVHCRIVLPVESEEWSAERRSAVLMHELAHVLRRDLIGHTISRVVCALYWFHPLVWTAAKHLRAESERACDDLALALGAKPSEYAEHLLDIVTQLRDRGTPAVALAMANPNEFEGRMLAILDPRIQRRGIGRGRAAWLAGSLAALALVVGAVAPARRAVATADETPGSSDRPTYEMVQNDTQTQAHTEAAEGEVQSVVKSTEHIHSAEAMDPVTHKDEADLVPLLAAADKQDDDDESDSDSNTKSANESQRVAVMAKALRTDTSPEVRRVAAWGLERYAEAPPAAEALASALGADADDKVREMAAWALAESNGNPAVTAALQKAFKSDKNREVRRTAAWSAGSIGHPSAVPGLVGLLADADPEVREVAAWSIGSCDPDKAPAELVRLLSDPNAGVRLSVVWALREIGDSDTADELEAAFNREKDPEVLEGLIRALGEMGDKAVETLTRLVSSPDPEMRAVAVAALAGGHSHHAWPWPRPEPRPFP
jgi:beta-lactamase regulating signal transducer with metallopeptidase domain/HEAT repeat protein